MASYPTSALQSPTVTARASDTAETGASWASSAPGKVRIAAKGELRKLDGWSRAFSRFRKDARYFDLVEETIVQEFEFRCFVIEDQMGVARAFQPFFLVDQDLVEGAPKFIKKALQIARRVLPRLLKARTLMVGCVAGEGQIDHLDDEQAAWVAQALQQSILKYARELRAALIVMKEFPARYRSALACFRSAGFTRVPSMPMTRVNIGYDDFDDYMTRTLSHSMRKNLRRKFRDAEKSAPIELTVLSDLEPVIEEVYPLYLQVYERSALHFEKLTREFLVRLGRELPDRARFFVWRQNGKAIAFSACLVHGDCLYDEYIGLDYSVALDLHLYFYTLRDITNWGIRNGCRWYMSTALNYDPKLHLKHELLPLDLYVRHTSGLANVVLSRVLPLLEPTRSEKALAKFSNFAEVWGSE